MGRNYNDVMLFDLLQEMTTRVPQFLKACVVKEIFKKWRRESSLVDDVASERTTFEEAVRPLVEENKKLTFLNKRGVCNSPRFEILAKEVSSKFAGILPMIDKRTHRYGATEYNLLDTVDFELEKRRLIRFCLVLAVVLVCGLSILTLLGFAVPWLYSIIGSICLTLLVFIVQLFVAYPLYLADRKVLAEATLQRAKFLDEMFNLQKE